MRGLFGIEGFAEPLWIPVVCLAAAAALLAAARRRPAALPWPALPEAAAAGARRFDWLRGAALALRAGALLAAGLVLAEPFARAAAAPGEARGLDLVLALDASASMRALDVSAAGESRTRLELAREAVARFAHRRAAGGDRVGLVVFGEHAFTQVPLTRDGHLLEAALERVEAGMAGEATALGDALTLAVKRALAGAGEPGAAGAPQEGRLVVLLTDGRSNAGEIPVDVAAEVARSHAVRVHTVGIGTRGEVPVAGGGRGLRFERHDLDAPTLERIAGVCGGRFFPARSSADLEAVYAAIDALERVARPDPPRPETAPRPAPLLLAAAGLLLAEIGLARGWRRRLP